MPEQYAPEQYAPEQHAIDRPKRKSFTTGANGRFLVPSGRGGSARFLPNGSILTASRHQKTLPDACKHGPKPFGPPRAIQRTNVTRNRNPGWSARSAPRDQQRSGGSVPIGQRQGPVRIARHRRAVRSTTVCVSSANGCASRVQGCVAFFRAAQSRDPERLDSPGTECGGRTASDYEPRPTHPRAGA